MISQALSYLCCRVLPVHCALNVTGTHVTVFGTICAALPWHQDPLVSPQVAVEMFVTNCQMRLSRSNSNYIKGFLKPCRHGVLASCSAESQNGAGSRQEEKEG